MKIIFNKILLYQLDVKFLFTRNFHVSKNVHF